MKKKLYFHHVVNVFHVDKRTFFAVFSAQRQNSFNCNLFRVDSIITDSEGCGKALEGCCSHKRT